LASAALAVALQRQSQTPRLATLQVLSLEPMERFTMSGRIKNRHRRKQYRDRTSLKEIELKCDAYLLKHGIQPDHFFFPARKTPNPF
jgi:hypothetical protein